MSASSMEEVPDELLCCILRTASAATLGRLGCTSKQFRRRVSGGESWRGATEATFSAQDVQKAIAACSDGWRCVYRFLLLSVAHHLLAGRRANRVAREDTIKIVQRSTKGLVGTIEAMDTQLRRIRAPIDTLGYDIACPSQMELMMIATLEEQMQGLRTELSAATQQIQEFESEAERARLDEAAALAHVVSLREGLPIHLQDPVAILDGQCSGDGAGGGAGSSSGTPAVAADIGGMQISGAAVTGDTASEAGATSA